MIKIQEITKEFLSLRGRVVALNEVSLEVDPGTFYVLLGPSGCGKTTLLNIIAGLEKPSSGEVWIGEKPMVSTDKRLFVTPRNRNVAMVFQSYALYPHMTVYDNIAFPLRMAKTDKGAIRNAVEDVARTLEISNLLQAKPAELSGGQRQRVAIGRAIVRRPAALLLDEPLSNLDAQLRVTMRRELKELQRRMAVTTVYVTHDQMEAMTLGDRIAIMNGGRVEQIGAPDEVYNKPATVFAARFVGTPPMNLLEGETFAAGGAGQRLLRCLASESMAIEDILFGVRPENLRVTRDRTEAVGAEGHKDLLSGNEETLILRCRVTMIGSLGVERLVYLKVGDQEVLAKCPAGAEFSEGDEVVARLDKRDLLVFNKSDGRRVD